MMFLMLAFVCGADPTFTVENRCPPAFVVVNKVPAVRPVQVIPSGFHAHTRADGTVIVHADANHGSAAAHAGIVWPWNKTGVAGQVVPSSYPVIPDNSIPFALPASSQSCPNGICPTASVPAPVLFPRLFRR